MSRSVLGLVLLLVGVLFFVLAGPLVGGTAAVVIGLVLAVAGIVVFLTADRDL